MMTRRPTDTNNHSEGSSGNQLLALSLFIMLLAFFIILNALSSYEETKSRPVIDSIERAFSSRITERGKAQPSMAPDEQQDIKEGDTFDKLKALFQSQVPAYEATVSRRRGIMHVELSYEDFRDAVFSLQQVESERSALSGEFFLPALVALVTNEKAGTPYRMDILLKISRNPAALENSNPADLLETMKTLGGLAAKITDAGLPENFMSIGLEKGQSGTVELLFQPYRPYNPLNQTTSEGQGADRQAAPEASAGTQAGEPVFQTP